MHKTGKEKEKAVLITVDGAVRTSWRLEDRVDELNRLTRACGVDVAGNMKCSVKRVTPDLFIGKGKAEEISLLIKEKKAAVAVFNNDLSPSQQKNLEKVFEVKIIDRTQLILDIFSRRASSKEGKVQVELAQLMYLLPRLSRMWLHLSRQRGGIGTRGPGEQQLEVDRRRVREKISVLKKKLKDIRKHRDAARLGRGRFSSFSIALVGYTNSGKSTLFNALTDSSVKVKDQLFSTLDPVIRKIDLTGNRNAVISDTVGFLRELPHHLIESFKTTLEETVNADILLHVMDMSSDCMDEQKEAVHKVLDELKVKDKPLITVLNKSDKMTGFRDKERIIRKNDGSVMISALKREGITELKDRIIQFVDLEEEDIEIVLPHKHYALSKLIYDHGTVKHEEYQEKGLYIKARLPKKVKYALFKQMKR